ncbi:hypothetical protein B0H13DRAFT_1856395 [Mycena leptocephala]|nr:hypothetical protein B0H13DRAFT_1856395 [Mycena leptocephala]
MANMRTTSTQLTWRSLNDTETKVYDIHVVTAGDQGHRIRHEAAAVANHEFPFQSDDAAEIFARALNDAKAEGIIPLQLGVSPEEWSEGGYPETEIVKAGKKYVEITLPFPIWWARAVAWAQGLQLMAKIQAAESGDIVVP